jgi:hypothetical protein
VFFPSTSPLTLRLDLEACANVKNSNSVVHLGCANRKQAEAAQA